MNNIIDFVLRLKDLTSGPVQKIAQAAQSSFGRVDASVARSQNNVTGLGRTVSGLSARLDELTRQRDLMVNTGDLRRANMEIAAIERRMARMRGEGVSGGGGGMRLPGWMGMAAVGAGVGAGITSIVKAGANAQQDLIGLSTFLGKDQAGKVYEQIQKDAASTPFGTKGLLSANRALISAGVGAEKARKDVLGLANAIAATGGGDDELGRMAQNLQQIRNAGVATAADIKQFGYAGINIYQLLANATKKPIAEVQKMSVSYNMLTKSLRMAAMEGGIYAGAMEAQSKSISGKWSTLMDNLDIAMAKIGMSQSNAITGLIDTLIGVTDRLPALAEQGSKGIALMMKGVISLTERLISMAKWLYHNWYWLKYVAGIAASMYASYRLLTIVTGVYNSLLAVAAMRATLFGTATAGATAATTGLNLAMLATPWGIAALAIGGVVTAMMLLNSQTKELPEHVRAATETLDRFEEMNIARKKAIGIEKINTVPTPGIVNAVSAPPISVGKYPWKRNNNMTPYNPAGAEAVEKVGTSITGGGGKVINITFKNMVEKMEITGATAEERGSKMEANLKEILYRIMAGIPA